MFLHQFFHKNELVEKIRLTSSKLKIQSNVAVCLDENSFHMVLS